MEKVNIPEGIQGEYRIEKFVTDRTDWSSLFCGRAVPVGEKFTRLMRDCCVMMSDTPAEMNDQRWFISLAKGNVLIAGLGIGFVLNMVAQKSKVSKVTVIEISTEIIKLVAPTYEKKFGNKIEIVQADILTWKPPKGIIYDCAWYDIWEVFVVITWKK